MHTFNIDKMDKGFIRYVVFALFALAFVATVNAQVGISVTPPRVYYTVDPGFTETKEVVVTNVSESHTMELAITLGDWMYNEYGENMMFPADSLDNSCAAWVSVPSASYISLKPKESRAISVGITVPSDIGDMDAVHTAMLYVTQMNPVDDVNEQGANIKINVRSGIKLFHRTSVARKPKVEITNLTVNKEEKSLWLEFNNEGNVWLEGLVNTYLFESNSGKELELSPSSFYTMPGDARKMRIALPEDLQKGQYTATLMIDYGDANNVEAAEIEFGYE